MKTQTINGSGYCPEAAVRYARVLGELNPARESVEQAKEILEKVPALSQVLASPAVPMKKKLDVIDRIFPEELRNFMKVVCKYQRVDLAGDIFKAYDRQCDEQQRILQAVLLCTEPPEEEQKQGMEAFLCRKYGASRARIRVCTDESLLGGFILRVGSDEYDWSIKGRLDRLKEKLTWR